MLIFRKIIKQHKGAHSIKRITLIKYHNIFYQDKENLYKKHSFIIFEQFE